MTTTDQLPPPPPPMQPPPPPAFSPPKTSYHVARQEELDAIRRKGLTKIFNKHFTTVASKIQEERAAAELALAELEKRKAELALNPKSFSAGGMTLTQLDQLYMELKKRKNDVTRKERETQELYRRYVSQYGGGEDAKVDATSRKRMPLIHEYAPDDIVWQSDLIHTKSTEMNEATKDSDVGKLANNFNADDSNVAQSPPQHRDNTEAKKTHKATTVSSVSQETFPKLVASPSLTSITSTNSNNNASATPQEHIIVGTHSLSGSISQQDDDKSANNNDSLLGSVMVTTKSSSNNDLEGDDGDEDSDSTLSSITNIDSATVVEAEWRLTEFLRVETENIRKMFADEDHEDNNHNLVAGEVSEAARKAEEMVKQMEAATAWMKNPTLLDYDSDEEEKKDIDNKSSPLHKWRSYWSEDHEREYYHNIETGQTCWTKPNGVEIDITSLKRIGRQSNSDETDINKVDSQSVNTYNIGDADSVTVKDYTKSRRRIVDIVNPTEYTNEEMIDVFRPDNDAVSVGSRGSIKQASKVLQYRRRRAKMRRIKRRLRIAFILAIMVSTVLFVYRSQLKSILRDIIPAKQIEIEDIVDVSEARSEVEDEEEHKEELDDKSSKEVVDEADSTLVTLLESNEKMTTEFNEEVEIEQPQIKEEGHVCNNFVIESQHFNKEEDVLVHEAIQQNDDKLEIQGDEDELGEGKQVLNLDDNVEATALQEIYETRPWACAIPFAYISSRKCSSLAKTQPLFDCKALIDSMME